MRLGYGTRYLGEPLQQPSWLCRGKSLVIRPSRYIRPNAAVRIRFPSCDFLGLASFRRLRSFSQGVDSSLLFVISSCISLVVVSLFSFFRFASSLVLVSWSDNGFWSSTCLCHRRVCDAGSGLLCLRHSPGSSCRGRGGCQGQHLWLYGNHRMMPQPLIHSGLVEEDTN